MGKRLTAGVCKPRQSNYGTTAMPNCRSLVPPFRGDQLRHGGAASKSDYGKSALMAGPKNLVEDRMIGTLITIHPDGTTTRQSVQPNHYRDLKAKLGGEIELVADFVTYEGQPCDAYVRDDGILAGLETNRIACELWWAQIDESTPTANALAMLHGPLAIVTGDAEFIKATR